MSNKIYNKVVFGNETLIDLTADTITASDVINSKTFHKADGTTGTGSCTYDADTSDATVTASEIITGKTAYKNGVKLTGTMTSVGAQTITIDDVDDEITITNGYHDGSGKAKLDAVEKAKIIAANIKNGVEILGVTGTYTGSELIKATTGSATPQKTQQTILPSSSGDFDYFTQFTVAAIPFTETLNASGGYTATIGATA